MFVHILFGSQEIAACHYSSLQTGAHEQQESCLVHWKSYADIMSGI
jgi:hypothetical protein